MHPTSVGGSEENCIKVANKAVKILNDWDPTKGSKKEEVALPKHAKIDYPIWHNIHSTKKHF